jgi:hypothetical protein
MKTRHIALLTAWGLLAVVLALLWLLTLPLGPASAQGTTRYVASYGFDNTPCNDPARPCRTIQRAIDLASAGDTIRVATGTYADINDHGDLAQVAYIDKSITLRGGYLAPGFDDPPDPEANPTTLDAQELGRVIYITGEIDVMIEGLGITGGYAEELGGGGLGFDGGSGVYISAATVNLANNQIFSNHHSDLGCGLYVANSDTILTDNVINGNATCTRGGGAYVYKSQITLERNIISANRSGYGGGGLNIAGSQATLNDNTFDGNVANRYGGGLSLYESTALLSANSFLNNLAKGTSAGHYDGGGGLRLENSQATIIGSTFDGNTAVSYGGGLCSVRSTATLLENTITANSSAEYGGGAQPSSGQRHDHGQQLDRR